MKNSSRLLPILIVFTLLTILYHVGTFDFKTSDSQVKSVQSADQTNNGSGLSPASKRSDAENSLSPKTTKTASGLNYSSSGNKPEISVRPHDDAHVKNEIILLEEEAIGWSESGNMAMMELAIGSLAARGKESLPALIELFLRYPHHSMILGYIDELQDASTFPLLRQAFLDTKNPRIKDAFMRLLGANPSKESTTFLMTLFQQQHEGEWSNQLIYSLSRRPESAPVDLLLNTLRGTKHINTANTIINSLSDRDDPRIEQVLLDILAGSLETGSTINPLTHTILGALGRRGDQNTAYRLLELLPRSDSPHWGSDSAAFYSTIGQLLGNKALPVLVELSEQQMLGDFPDKDTFLTMTDDQLFRTVSDLVVQRGQLRLTPHQLSGLIGFLADSHRPEAGPLLIQLYHDPTTSINRSRLLNAIASTQSTAAFDFLGELIQSQNPEYIRWTSFNALKESFKEDAAPIFAGLVKNQDQLAVQAYDALMNIGGPAADDIAAAYRKRIVVQGLINDSQAMNVGLQPGDVIISYDRREITDAKELQQNVRRMSRFEPIELEIDRNGTLFSFVVEGGGIGIYMQEAIKPL